LSNPPSPTTTTARLCARRHHLTASTPRLDLKGQRGPDRLAVEGADSSARGRRGRRGPFFRRCPQLLAQGRGAPPADPGGRHRSRVARCSPTHVTSREGSAARNGGPGSRRRDVLPARPSFVRPVIGHRTRVRGLRNRRILDGTDACVASNVLNPRSVLAIWWSVEALPGSCLHDC
jgi:hypothetical protein